MAYIPLPKRFNSFKSLVDENNNSDDEKSNTHNTILNYRNDFSAERSKRRQRRRQRHKLRSQSSRIPVMTSFTEFPMLNEDDYQTHNENDTSKKSYKELTLNQEKPSSIHTNKYIEYKNLRFLYDCDVKEGYIVMNRNPALNRANIDVAAYNMEDEHEEYKEWIKRRREYVDKYDQKVESGEIDLSWMTPEELDFSDLYTSHDVSGDGAYLSDSDAYSD